MAELDFSENISFLGYNAFHDATSLKKVTIRSDISVESGGLSYVFENAGIEQIVVADGVTKIPSYLFQHGIASLTELSLPDTLTEIGVHSFSGCSVLRNLDIPASVNKIGIYAFEDATSLKSLRMKNSWRFSSFASPFEGSGIEILTVDDGIAKVPGYLLSNGCEHLTDVYLPASVATVENSAFAGCGNVTCHFAGTESEWANVALGNWTPAMVICSDTTLMGMARAEVDESADALISDLKDEAELTENSEENNKEESDTDTVGDTETEEPIAGEEGASNEDETISDDDPNDENDVATNNDIPEETEDEDSDIVHIDADINQEENQFEITEENSDDSDGDPPEEEPFSSEDAITSKKHDEDGEEDEGG